MAVPKTTETRCMNGSVQEKQVINRLHKQSHPYIIFLHLNLFCEFSYEITGNQVW